MSGKNCDCEEGLPEWIMSYADMITILMAFFVVMYSMAGNRDQAKEEAVLRSLREQFGPMLPSMAALGPGPYINRNSPLAKLAPVGKAMKSPKDKPGSSETPSSGQHAKVHTLRPGEQAAIGGIIQFAEGSAELSPEQKQQIEIAAAEVGGKPQKIEIRGHTSRRPVPHGAPFRDNWDLAYQRCRAVMQYLVEHGIDAKRIRLGVAADNEPLASDDTLAINQSSRVEVTILNEPVEAKQQTANEDKPSEPDRTSIKATSR